MADPVVTLKFWHGGKFKSDDKGLHYVGGAGKTFMVDVDELCWWYLEELVQKCGKYTSIHRILYLIPGQRLDDGLRKVYSDSEVRVMGEIALQNRGVELYVEHGVDNPMMSDNLEKGVEVVLKGMIDGVSQKTGPTTTKDKVKPTQAGLNTPKDKVKPTKTGPIIPKVQVKPTSEKAHLNIGKRITRLSPNKHLITLNFQLHSPTKQNKSTKNKDPAKSNQTTAVTVSHQTQNQNTFTHFSQTQNTATVQPENLIPPQTENSPTESSQTQKTPTPNVDEKSEDEPLTYDYSSDDDESDHLYELEHEEAIDEGMFIGDDNDLEKELEELEREAEGEQSGGESSDEEFQAAKNNLRVSRANLAATAAQLQREADEGRLKSQNSELRSARERRTVGNVQGDVTDYEKSEDEINTPENSEDEGIGAQIRKQRKFVSSDKIDYNCFKWEVGLRFPSRTDFRAVVSKFAIIQGRDLYYVVSVKGRNQRLCVKCMDGCPFRLYASWDNSSASFLVKSLEDQHTCVRTMKANRQLKTPWLANQLLDVFKARPHWPADQILETVKRAYKVNIKRDKAYKVKWLAHQMLHGSMTDHYKKVGRYLAALGKACPQSCFILEKEPNPLNNVPTFKRLFCSFDALKNGWLNGCRKVLCIDGCFLKTFLGGQLLGAIGRDGNDQMFPVAWAIVEGECNESWEWFFVNLQQTMNAGDGVGWTIISDEHQGILNACAKVLLEAEHRHCARHIFAHWHKKNRGEEMKKFFWNAAWCYTEADMEEVLEEMGKVSPSAVDDFRALNPTVFCRAYMNVDSKCDVITSNMAETFNGFIIQARTKHLIEMLEDIRCALMQRLVVKRLAMEKSNALLCPRPATKLEKEKLLAADCYVMPSSETVFGVNHKLDKLVVDLGNRTCTCRKWDLTGLPCCHAIACIFFMYKQPESYVHPCYIRQTYLKSYSFSIPPIEGDKHWPKVNLDLLPPPIKVGPGRPRKARRKDPYENPKNKGKLTRHCQVLSCSVCKSKTHTKRKCPDKDKEVEPQAKRGRGRPRKTDINPNQSSQPDSTQPDSTITAQPTQLGRNGRTVRGGRGSRGGRSGGRGSAGGGRGSAGGASGSAGGASGGRGSAGGRGLSRSGRRGKGYIPRGFGVFVTKDGTPITNVSNVQTLRQSPRPRMRNRTTLSQPKNPKLEEAVSKIKC